MPGAIEGIHNKASKELHEITQSFIKSIRWRQGASGRHSPIAQVSFEWSLNKTDWYHMPSAYSISMSTPKGIDIGKQALESVRSLMLENIGEPTYHELLRGSDKHCRLKSKKLSFNCLLCFRNGP